MTKLETRINREFAVPKKKTFIKKLVLNIKNLFKRVEVKRMVSGLWLAKLDRDKGKKMVDAEFKLLEDKTPKMSCLWCKTPTSQLLTYGKGDNIRMMQACDKFCAHDIIVIEKLDKVMENVKEEETEFKPSKDIEYFNKVDIPRIMEIIKEKEEKKENDAGSKIVEFDFINDEPDNEFGFV